MNALVCWGVAEGGGWGQGTYARRLLEGLVRCAGSGVCNLSSHCRLLDPEGSDWEQPMNAGPEPAPAVGALSPSPGSSPLSAPLPSFSLSLSVSGFSAGSLVLSRSSPALPDSLPFRDYGRLSLVLLEPQRQAGTRLAAQPRRRLLCTCSLGNRGGVCGTSGSCGDIELVLIL